MGDDTASGAFTAAAAEPMFGRSPFPPIADYAFLSDCECNCLIAPAARRYLPGSLMLETTWQTRTGWLIVRDALCMGPWHNVDERSRTHRRSPTDFDAEHCLLRTVKCVSGAVDVSMTCEPVFDYGQVEPQWTYEGAGYGSVLAASPEFDVTVRLTTD